jgi:cytochrome b
MLRLSNGVKKQKEIRLQKYLPSQGDLKKYLKANVETPSLKGKSKITNKIQFIHNKSS